MFPHLSFLFLLFNLPLFLTPLSASFVVILPFPRKRTYLHSYGGVGVEHRVFSRIVPRFSILFTTFVLRRFPLR